ncbi:hypothetical protein ACHAC9_22205 [Massilia sp. CMS3.1]|uniref:hypothetical protein n=1 Tax=Massilia sp. CMS3.1 TaxID=3373083 RepID=UPI003EE79A76
MTTADKILRAIEHAVDLANRPAVSPECRGRTFTACLAGTLDDCGPDAEAVAEKVFALGRPSAVEPTVDEQLGMDWWNSLTEKRRAHWLAKAGSAAPFAAWQAFRAAEDDLAQGG